MDILVGDDYPGVEKSQFFLRNHMINERPHEATERNHGEKSGREVGLGLQFHPF